MVGDHLLAGTYRPLAIMSNIGHTAIVKDPNRGLTTRMLGTVLHLDLLRLRRLNLVAGSMVLALGGASLVSLDLLHALAHLLLGCLEDHCCLIGDNKMSRWRHVKVVQISVRGLPPRLLGSFQLRIVHGCRQW